MRKVGQTWCKSVQKNEKTSWNGGGLLLNLQYLPFVKNWLQGRVPRTNAGRRGSAAGRTNSGLSAQPVAADADALVSTARWDWAPPDDEDREILKDYLASPLPLSVNISI